MFSWDLLRPGLFTLGQTRFPFGDVVHALDSKGPRLIHQQHGAPVRLDLQDGPLHPHQRHRQSSTLSQPDDTSIPANICPPAVCRPQLTREDLNGRKTFSFSGCFLCFGHYRLPLSFNDGSSLDYSACISRVPLTAMLNQKLWEYPSASSNFSSDLHPSQ